MGPDTSELQLRNWFGYLQSFKTCAEKIDTDVIALSLLDFANAKPTTYLAEEVDQSQFAVCVANATQIPMQSFRCKRRGELCGAPGSNVWRREPVCSSVSAVSFAGSV